MNYSGQFLCWTFYEHINGQTGLLALAMDFLSFFWELDRSQPPYFGFINFYEHLMKFSFTEKEHKILFYARNVIERL